MSRLISLFLYNVCINFFIQFNVGGAHTASLSALMQKVSKEIKADGFFNAQNLLICLKPVNSLRSNKTGFFTANKKILG